MNRLGQVLFRRSVKERLAQRLRRLTWTKLRRWGNSRVLKSSYIFLLVVPIVAKLMAPFGGRYVITVSWIDRPLEVDIALPFRWVIFYGMAVCFAAGQFVYGFACPEIVKDYASFAEYRKSHKGFALIAHWLQWLSTRHRNSRILEKLSLRLNVALRLNDVERNRIQTFLTEATAHYNSRTRVDLWREYERLLLQRLDDDATLSDVFSALRANAERIRRGWLWLSAGFFLLGFALLAIILWQNCEFVANAWLGE